MREWRGKRFGVMVVVGVLISAASWTETLLNTSGNEQVEDVERHAARI